MTEAASVKDAEDILEDLWKSGDLNHKAVILVGNKTDLVRTREVHIDGRYLIYSETTLMFASRCPILGNIL